VSFKSGAPVRQPVPDMPGRLDPEMLVAPNTSESEESALVYFRLLWDHRGFLSRLALYALLASTLTAFLIPVRYQSTARLMPPDSNQGASSLAAVAAAVSGSSSLGGIANDVLGSKSTSDIFVGILSSRTVQDKLIQEFDLKRLYWDRRMEDARDDLTSHTAIAVDRKSQIIAITVTDKSPRRAAAMAQAYVEELNRLVAELSTSSARRERIFLEGRLQAVTQDLEGAEREFSQFASKNAAIDIKEQGKAMVEAAATLQGELIAAQSEYEGLKQIYTDNNVRVRSVKARIDELQHQLEKLGGKGESESSLAGQQSDSLYPSIRKLPLLGVTFADLYRRTRVQEAVFETLTKEYELAKVQEAKEIPTVKVLDLPDIPEKRSFPPRIVIIVLGMVLVFAGGVLWVFCKTLWYATDASDPRKLLAQEVFSTVSHGLPGFSQNVSDEHAVNGKSRSWIPGRRDDVEKWK
jgi:capsule polysaccharide export protein KpsE/RkpR